METNANNYKMNETVAANQLIPDSDLSTHLLDYASGASKTIQTNDGNYNAWPVVVKTSKNKIFVFYSVGIQHAMGDLTRHVVYKTSTNSGITWSEEKTLVNDEYDDSVFSACVTDRGTILVIIKRFSANGLVFDNAAIRSTDDGETWGTEYPISYEGFDPTISSPIVYIPDKGLMMGWQDYDDSFNVIWSHDDGITWADSQKIINSPDDNSKVPVETRYVYVGNGKILGIGRREVGGSLFQIQSQDYGKTWTVADTNITDEYRTPSALILQDNEIDIVYCDRIAGVLRRRHVNVDTIWDNPQAWPLSQKVKYGSFDVSNFGYPHSIAISKDTCLCVYYSGNELGTGIYGFYYSFEDNLYFKTPLQTTSPLTYYVDGTIGSDNNDGLTPGTAFKSIKKAVLMIPQIVNHPVVINCAAGNYSSEGVIKISGYNGKREININGADSTVVSRFIISKCSIPITINRFTANEASNEGSFVIASSISVVLSYCNCLTPLSSNGIHFTNSIGTVNNCVLSNRIAGIRSVNSQIYSENNSGTGNTYGLYAEKCGTIGKNGEQPTGSESQKYTTGGTIR